VEARRESEFLTINTISCSDRLIERTNSRTTVSNFRTKDQQKEYFVAIKQCLTISGEKIGQRAVDITHHKLMESMVLCVCSLLLVYLPPITSAHREYSFQTNLFLIKDQSNRSHLVEASRRVARELFMFPFFHLAFANNRLLNSHHHQMLEF